MSKSLASERMIARMSRRTTLSDADREAIHGLPFVEREVPPSGYLVREAQRPTRCAFLIKGYTFRQKLTADGARQILSLQVPGDFIDLQNLFLRESDHNVQALTLASVAEIEMAALREAALARPALAEALWTEALVEASIFREWIVNVGRRKAQARVGHLLCEFATRLKDSGVELEHAWELPMTQEQIADAVGLTPVHVNRVLKALAQRELIGRDRRQIRILDWEALRDASDFNPRYLHLTKPIP